MRRYHQELARTRRGHRTHLRYVHNWPVEPVDCECDHQAGRFRKRHAIGCNRVRCGCKAYKLKPSVRDRRLAAFAAAEIGSHLNRKEVDGSED